MHLNVIFIRNRRIRKIERQKEKDTEHQTNSKTAGMTVLSELPGTQENKGNRRAA